MNNITIEITLKPQGGVKFLLGVHKIGFFSIHSLLRNCDNAGANAPDALSRFFRNDCYVSFFSHSVDKQPQ